MNEVCNKFDTISGNGRNRTTSSLEPIRHEMAKMSLGRNDRSPRLSFRSDTLSDIMLAAARLDANETWWAEATAATTCEASSGAPRPASELRPPHPGRQAQTVALGHCCSLQ
jgi:hypothetical protein